MKRTLEDYACIYVTHAIEHAILPMETERCRAFQLCVAVCCSVLQCVDRTLHAFRFPIIKKPDALAAVRNHLQRTWDVAVVAVSILALQHMLSP